MQYETLDLDPATLGTLEVADSNWVPYADLYDLDFLPTRIRLGNDAYAYNSSIIVRGHGAVLPKKLADLRAAGKKPLIIEREDRYYIFITPP